MIRYLFVSLILLLTHSLSATETHSFTLTGHITGLQKGDTLRFERVVHPIFNLEAGFDIIIEHPDSFSYTGRQEHDQDYLMKYLPKEGTARPFARLGLSLIITDGDSINISGSTDAIYYSELKGGIYDDPLLSEVLRLDNSLGITRSNYLYEAEMARSQNDTARAEQYSRLFNEFGKKGSDPRFGEAQKAQKAYAEANPTGTLYLLVEALGTLNSNPIEDSKSLYDSWNQELKDSYYGRLFATELSDMERLLEGQPTPAFAVTSIDGNKVTQNDFKNRYLLIYHWGLCPGSVYIDGKVRDLYDRYSDRGLDVLGVTESVNEIRNLYEYLPKDKKTPYVYVDDLLPVVEGMLNHQWTEVELDTDHPENKSLTEAFRFAGWPFFVLIGPEGTIRARGYIEAFDKAVELLDKELGAKTN